MRFINYLQEEYCADITKDLTVYVNPSATEIGKIGKKDIRFIADQRSKELFIWNGERAIHVDIFDYLIDKHIMQDVDTPTAWRNKYLLTGVAVNKAGKLDFTDSDQIFADIRNGEHNEYIYDMMEFDWKWLRPYFTNLEFIYDMKRKIKKKKQ